MNLDNIILEPIIDSVQLLKISDEDYFGPLYADYISNSRLKLIDPDKGGSPQSFFDGFAANKLYSDSLVFGSAVHECLLQPEYFFICDSVNRPSAKLGFIADILYEYECELSNDCILRACSDVDYYHGNLTDNQILTLRKKIMPYIDKRREFENNLDSDKTPIYLDEKSREKLYLCMNNLNTNSYIQNLLHPMGLLDPIESMNEWAILLDIKVTVDNGEPFIIKLKSKLDNFTIDKENNLIVINDLKTHGNYIDTFKDAVINFSYHRELAFYSTLMRYVAKKYYNLDNPTIRGNFLVVSTVPDYYTTVYRMTKELFYDGMKDFQRLLRLVCYYKYYGFQREETVLCE